MREAPGDVGRTLTQAINVLRGDTAEFGVIAAKGSVNIDVLLSALADHPTIPDVVKGCLKDGPLCCQRRYEGFAAPVL